MGGNCRGGAPPSSGNDLHNLHSSMLCGKLARMSSYVLVHEGFAVWKSGLLHLRDAYSIARRMSALYFCIVLAVLLLHLKEIALCCCTSRPSAKEAHTTVQQLRKLAVTKPCYSVEWLRLVTVRPASSCNCGSRTLFRLFCNHGSSQAWHAHGHVRSVESSVNVNIPRRRLTSEPSTTPRPCLSPQQHLHAEPGSIQDFYARSVRCETWLLLPVEGEAKVRNSHCFPMSPESSVKPRRTG